MSRQLPAPEEAPIPLDASMLNGLPDPVFLVDLKHVIVDCNRAARQLLGRDTLGSMLEGAMA